MGQDEAEVWNPRRIDYRMAQLGVPAASQASDICRPANQGGDVGIADGKLLRITAHYCRIHRLSGCRFGILFNGQLVREMNRSMVVIEEK